MYRDLIGAPTMIEMDGITWWIQELCGFDGRMKSVLLFDADGDLVAEFQSMEEIEFF